MKACLRCACTNGGALLDLVIGVSVGFIVLAAVGVFQNSQFRMFMKQRAQFDLQDEFQVIEAALEKNTIDIVDIKEPASAKNWSESLEVEYPLPAGGTAIRKIYLIKPTGQLMIQPDISKPNVFVIADGVISSEFLWIEGIENRRLLIASITVEKPADPGKYISDTRVFKYRLEN